MLMLAGHQMELEPAQLDVDDVLVLGRPRAPPPSWGRNRAWKATTIQIGIRRRERIWRDAGRVGLIVFYGELYGNCWSQNSVAQRVSFECGLVSGLAGESLRLSPREPASRHINGKGGRVTL
jgi:hypothetical protein